MTYPYGNTGGPLCPVHGIPLSSTYRQVGMTTIREDYCPICAASQATARPIERWEREQEAG